jgi:hypothetical protein
VKVAGAQRSQKGILILGQQLPLLRLRGLKFLPVVQKLALTFMDPSPESKIVHARTWNHPQNENQAY